jgi:two-component system response regulator RegX3
MSHILLLEDHELSRVNLGQNLVREGFTVTACGTGGEAIERLRAAAGLEAEAIQVAILDLGLPDMDGLEVLKFIQGQPGLRGLAVLLLTERSELIDRVLGLELGADDYLPKPYAFRELLARIHAISRRAVQVPVAASATLLRHGGLSLDLERFTALAGTTPLDLPRREFELLAFLMRNPGRVHSRRHLLREVWKLEAGTGERTVDVHVQRLRSKLGADGERIVTVVGAGYRLD